MKAIYVVDEFRKQNNINLSNVLKLLNVLSSTKFLLLNTSGITKRPATLDFQIIVSSVTSEINLIQIYKIPTYTINVFSHL